MERKIIVGLISLAIIGLPCLAVAQIIPSGETEIRAKIAGLLSEVSALRNEFDVAKATEESARISQISKLIATLSKGARNDDVTTLQTLLAKDAKIYPEGYVTGYYGALTSSAVERFKNKQTEPKLIVESISSPRIFAITAVSNDTTATITWKTDVPTSAKIWWGSPGPLDPFHLTPTISGALSEDHVATFTGKMYPLTKYAFIISATDTKGNTVITPEQTYMTP